MSLRVEVTLRVTSPDGPRTMKVYGESIRVSLTDTFVAADSTDAALVVGKEVSQALTLLDEHMALCRDDLTKQLTTMADNAHDL